MDTALSNALAIGILVESVEVLELPLVTAAIKITAASKTLAEKELNWVDVSAQPIKQAKALKSTMGRATSASLVCAQYSRSGHAIEDCFLNPLNLNNKLSLPTKKFGKTLGNKAKKKHYGKVP